MQTRKLGPFTVSAVGLGCMNLSHAYDEPPSFAQAKRLLLRALDLGITHFDFARNLPVLDEFVGLAGESSCTPAQLALAWLLTKHSHVAVIPGTRSIAHLEENLGVLDVQLSDGTIDRLNRLFTPDRIAGPRYPATTQSEIDTEEFSIPVDQRGR
ncbi:MAG TPA: aldo/keto reductase [Steroidobacteraceae bacterium]|nr:aldo/keto reductase [Steroidobacteraceae bacterium]